MLQWVESRKCSLGNIVGEADRCDIWSGGHEFLYSDLTETLLHCSVVITAVVIEDNSSNTSSSAIIS